MVYPNGTTLAERTRRNSPHIGELIMAINLRTNRILQRTVREFAADLAEGA